MFKIDQVKALFDCCLCNQLLVDPVIIPCGNSICKKHLPDELFIENSNNYEKTFKCDICQIDHFVPREGIFINKHIQNALDIKLDTVKQNPVYEKVINGAQQKLAEIKALDKDPANFIYQHFEDIKREVDLRRENLKLRIDTYSDDIIESIEKNKSTCFELAKTADTLRTKIEKSEQELNQLIERFDTFNFDIEDKGDIIKNVLLFTRRLTRIIGQHKASLTANKMFSFEFKADQVEDIFGCFNVIETVSFQLFLGYLFFVLSNSFYFKAFESSMMDCYLQSKLIELCVFRKNLKWKLKYRGTRDGFKASDFHSRCDGVANTLSVVKAASGNIFGGYTMQAWHSKKAYIEDPHAFIFSLVNKEEDPFKSMVSNDGQYAIYGAKENGPTFGNGLGGRDLCIKSDSNTNINSFSRFGLSYKSSNYLNDTEKSKSILAGARHFQVEEIEVFAVSE
jgi:hypothetical protein